MKLLAVGLGDDSHLGLLPFSGDRFTNVPLTGETVLLGQNGSGKSRILELVEGVLTENGPPIGRQLRLTGEPVVAVGEILLGLERVREPDGDWPWFRRMLGELVQGTCEETVAGITACWSDWHGGEQSIGWFDGDDGPGWYNFDDEREYRSEISAPQPDVGECDLWLDRVHATLARRCSEQEARMLAAASTLAMPGEDSLVVSIQACGGGEVWLRWLDPPAELRSVLLSLVADGDIGPAGATLVADLEDRSCRYVRVLSLGSLREGAEGSPGGASVPVRVTRIQDRFDDPGLQVDQWLETQQPAGEHFEVRGEGGRVPASWVIEALDRLSGAANHAAPSFLSAKGAITIEYPGKDHDHAGDAGSVIILHSPSHHTPHEWVGLGAGTRRWVAAAVSMAVEELRTMPAAIVEPARLLIVDEPELHLHPSLQTDIAQWLSEQAQRGASVLVATHSHQMLDAEPPPSEILGVARQPGSGIALVPMAEDLLDAVGRTGGNGLMDALGLDPSAAIALTRGVLIVEGEHDRKVILRFHRADLERHRIRVQPIRGTNNAAAFAAAELWGLLGKKLCLLFDDTKGGDGEPISKEEKTRREILGQRDHWIEQGFDVCSVDFHLPDVIAALPEDAVNRAFPGCPKGWTWQSIEKAWRAENSNAKQTKGFKPFTLRHLSLPKKVDADTFVDAVLAEIHDGDQPHPSLTAAVDGAIAQLGPVGAGPMVSSAGEEAPGPETDKPSPDQGSTPPEGDDRI